MPNLLERFLRKKTTTPETAPYLEPIKVKANLIKHAYTQAYAIGTPAGWDEFCWVLNNHNKASKMLKGGKRYFFPNTRRGESSRNMRNDQVDYVYQTATGRFELGWVPEYYIWHSSDRIVLTV